MEAPTLPPRPRARACAAGGAPPAGRGASPRVLVVRLSAIGDVLHALPAVTALRRARPKARIAWVVEDRAAAVLRGHPALDEVLVLPRGRWGRARGRLLNWPRMLAEAAAFVGTHLAARFDAVLDLQGNLKSGLLAALSGAPARYGFASPEAREGNGFFVNRRVPLPRGVLHRVYRNLAVVEAFLGERVEPQDSAIPLSTADADWAEAALAANGLPPQGFAVLHPGTSGFGAFKRWPTARFGALAARIAADLGLAVAVTFGPGEDALAEGVRASSGGAAAPLPTPTLSALAELLRRARVFLSADTGPLHLAAAVGTRVLGIYGPKDERVYGPFGRDADGLAAPLACVTAGEVPCRPCALRWCPEPLCMTAIPVDEVFARLREVLA